MKKRIVILIILVLFTLSGCSIFESFQKNYDKANDYLVNGQNIEAIISMQKAIEIEPKNEEGYLGLAEIYIINMDVENAIDTVQLGMTKASSTKNLVTMQENIDNKSILEIIGAPYFEKKFREIEHNYVDIYGDLITRHIYKYNDSTAKPYVEYVDNDYYYFENAITTNYFGMVTEEYYIGVQDSSFVTVNTYEYDENNQLKYRYSSEFVDDNKRDEGKKEEFILNENGLVEKILHSNTETTYEYDSRDNVISKKYSNVDSKEIYYEKKYTYDHNNNMLTMIELDGDMIDEDVFEYDENNILIRCTNTYNDKIDITNYFYDEHNNLIEETTVSDSEYIDPYSTYMKYDEYGNMIEQSYLDPFIYEEFYNQYTYEAYWTISE